MTLKERLERLTASEILKKYFINYLPDGTIGKEIEILSSSVTSLEKYLDEVERQVETPGISLDQKIDFSNKVDEVRESLNEVKAKLDTLLEEKDTIYQAYIEKLDSESSSKKRSIKSRTMTYGASTSNSKYDEIIRNAENSDALIKKYSLEELQGAHDYGVSQNNSENHANLRIIEAAIKKYKTTSSTGTDDVYLQTSTDTSEEDKTKKDAEEVQEKTQEKKEEPKETANRYSDDGKTVQVPEYDAQGNVTGYKDVKIPNATTSEPFDVRLRRSDLFVYGEERVPFSSDEASPILSDLIDLAVSESKANAGHVVPASKNQYEALSQNADVYGTLSLMNPYSVTRLYHGLNNLSLSGGFVTAGTNRMLDIRDQKRFYDIKSAKDSTDNINVSNPTTTNIIDLMNNDKWGRTPYSYQDFVFCKYFGRIPNNRMITLRKYTAPTYDNLCWELMGGDIDDKLNTKFAPVATCVTYFGGDTGNNLSDIFKIKSGLNWGKVKAEIWGVNGDAGDLGNGQNIEKTLGAAMSNFGQQGMGVFQDVFPTIGKITNKTLSLAKFLAITKSPNAFDEAAANASQLAQGLHDPNTNGPYANRIQGPVNRIDEVYKREVGIKFENSITLKFAYKAHPIGGINTKAVMLDIMSNLLTMCSATAVFWGGGHRFMVAPREYPWTSAISPGIMKDLYNGKFFGQDGAIRKTLDGFINAGGGNGQGGWNWDNALSTLRNLGMGVLGVLSGAVNSLLGSLSGEIASKMGDAANSLLSSMGAKVGGNQSAYDKGKNMFTNIMANSQAVWRSNALKNSVLPSVQGLRSILIGAPVGNWHLTVGNPLNPIAVIGNLICEDVTFNFGQEIGPDDFPDELEATITLQHGMARDLAGIESMFNRGAGRIYQAPDYARMFAGQISSDQETKVDGVTGGTSSRVPAKFIRTDPGYVGKFGTVKQDTGHTLQNQGSSDTNINTPLNNIDVIDLDYNDLGTQVSRTTGFNNRTVRASYAGNWATRKYLDS